MLSIPIVSEFDGKGIKKAIAEFKQLETTGEKAQFALKKALVPATAALGGLAVAAKGAVSAASDMAEAQSKVNVIFGDGASEIAKFAATASSKIGQSKKAVMDAAGTFGTFGKAAGLGGKDLAKFSTGFTALASDLASFNNTTPEEAIEAIGAALRGESEPMRKFGVLLNDATLKAEAMALGIYDGNGALTAQQKILAAQSAIYKQTGDAQGDFERTSSGLANSQRTLKAQFDDMQVSLGQALLPAVNALLPKVKAFADWAAANPETFKIIAGSIAAVAAAIVAVNAASAANPYVIMAAAVIGLAVAFDRLAESVGRFNTRAGRQLRTIGGMLGIPMLPDDPLNWRSWLGINTKSTPSTGGGLSIPAMANGGIVTSPTLALIGEAGPEAVVPLNRANGMGNITVHVNGADPNAVVATLRRYMANNGTLPVRI